MLKSKLLSWHTYAPDDKMNTQHSPIEHNTPNTNSPDSQPDLGATSSGEGNKNPAKFVQDEEESSQYYSCESKMTDLDKSYVNNSLFE